MRRSSAGFTLMEVSITMVILGLLIGGVLAGRSLIEAANYRKGVKEFQEYSLAVGNFKEMFFAYPGDMPNAHTFWDTRCGGNSAAPTGCNGNGNGRIEALTESWRAWQHLFLAEMSKKNVSGTVVGSATLVGQNIPRSDAFPKAGYFLSYGNTLAGTITDKHHLLLGAERFNDFNNIPGLTAEQTMVLDEKLDDGLPTTGQFRGDIGFGSTDCYVLSAGTNVYNHTVSGYRCLAFYILE